MLRCPVKNCHLPLERNGKQLSCNSGHSFDIARSGYVNLLQPQERRSKQPGDTLAAISGRRRMHDLGVTGPLLEAIGELMQASPNDVVLDAGCGDGFYLGNLAKQAGFAGHGVDISVPAIEAAARRYPECEWIVANADREVPYPDATFSRVMSITARMNPTEFHRVIRNDGMFLAAIPASDDLIELRGAGRDRSARTIEMFSGHFALKQQHRVTTTAELDATAVQDVLHSIYRPMQSNPAEGKQVTLSLDLLLFRPV